MKQFIDFIPLLLFFIVFKLDPRTVEFAGQSIELGGIFSATGVLIASSVVVYGTLFAVQKRLEKGQWLTLAACLLFGGMTLAFHSETFLKWKAPVVNWLFALGFEDLDNGGTVVSQDLFNGRLHVFGTDRGERRQVVGLQKRVVHAHGWHLGWGNIAPS